MSYLQNNVFQDIYVFMGSNTVASANGRGGGSILARFFDRRDRNGISVLL